MKRRVTTRLLTLGAMAVLGCSLVVDTSDLDAQCPAGFKPCGDAGCVSEEDPAFGCRRDLCEPCPFQHGHPICREGECAADPCLRGFGCKNCVANLYTDESNCGDCNIVCGAGKICSAGTCVDPVPGF